MVTLRLQPISLRWRRIMVRPNVVWGCGFVLEVGLFVYSVHVLSVIHIYIVDIMWPPAPHGTVEGDRSHTNPHFCCPPSLPFSLFPSLPLPYLSCPPSLSPSLPCPLTPLLPSSLPSLPAHPFPSTHEGWSKIETIDSLLRKGGHKGQISESVRRTIRLMRYQSEVCTVTYSEYCKYTQNHKP